MNRKEAWPELLDEVFQRHYTTEFEWGVFDCCIFVCECIHAMTGIDMYADFKGKYTTELEAHQLVSDYVGLEYKSSIKFVSEIAEYFCSKYKLQVVEKSFAQRGDIALIDLEGMVTVGVVMLNGTHVAAPAYKKGLAFVPLKLCKKVWRV